MDLDLGWLILLTDSSQLRLFVLPLDHLVFAPRSSNKNSMNPMMNDASRAKRVAILNAVPNRSPTKLA